MLDAKLKRVRIKYGMEGYGLYWYCLELVAQGVEPHNLTFELEHDAEIIAHDTGIHHERVSEMMIYMVDLGLFESSHGVVTCLKLAARTDEYTQKLLRGSDKLRINSGHTPDKVPPIRREEKRIDNTTNVVAAKGDAKPCPHQEIIELYHKHLPMCPAVKQWTDKRQSLLRQRWKEEPERQDVEWWARFFGYISNSSFLTGRVNTNPDRKPFVVDLEWIIKPSNFVKIIEGRYEDE